MAAPGLPITFAERLNVANLGINADCIRFGNLTMESDKFLCVRQQAAGGAAELAIIDMTNGNRVEKHSIGAENAIMNPVTKVVALRGAWCVVWGRVEGGRLWRGVIVPFAEFAQRWEIWKARRFGRRCLGNYLCCTLLFGEN